MNLTAHLFFQSLVTPRTFKKSCAVLLTFTLLFVQFVPLFVSDVYAATSPWAQTDWSGGSGQTAWVDETQYSAGSAVTTSVSGEVTLQATSSWYNTSWGYRRKITFDNSAQAENLTNFPVLVRLDSTRINYSNTQNAGQDIRFTDSDGTTLLSHEIESWDEAGNSFVWVKVPQIDASSATDFIYIYYGNSGASDAQDATNVWDSSYKGVWHLKETGNGTAGEYNDATSNNNDGRGGAGTASYVPSITTSGKVNGAQTFDGTDDFINVGTNSTLRITTAITISAWIKTSAIGNFTGIVTRMNDGPPYLGYSLGMHGAVAFFHAGSTYTPNNLYGVITVNNNAWHHVVGIYNGTTSYVYVDGVLDVSATKTNNLDGGASEIFDIGADYARATGRFFNGLLDEIRVSNTARSAAWIAASYKSEGDTFNTYASEESVYSTASGTLTSSIFDSEFSVGSAWGALTYTATTPTNTSVSVKVRSSDSASMTGATDFASCTAVTSGSDLSSSSCVTDGDRYIQYQVTLANTDSVSTPTFSDISIAFDTYDSVGPTLTLESPGDNAYTNQERPTFKWKAATDAISAITDYDFTLDNPSAGSSAPSGDFVLTDIPVTRSSDYDLTRYTIKYDNFTDADTTNDYLSLLTKSHTEWGSQDLDGTLREGKASWKVKATDAAGNQTEASRTLFIDKTPPKIEVALAGTPLTITGKITDPLSGGDPSKVQDENGPRVASGPQEVTFTIQRRTALGYVVTTIYTLNINENYYTCDDTKITDNAKQKCDKYYSVHYTPKEALTAGTYKISVAANDKAGNSASESFTQTIGASDTDITTQETVEIGEEVEILKEVPTPQSEPEMVVPQAPSALKDSLVSRSIGVLDTMLTSIGTLLTKTGKGIGIAFQSLGTGIQFVNATAESVATATGEALAFVTSAVSEGEVILSNGQEYALQITVSTLSLLGQTIGEGIGGASEAIGQGIAVTGQEAAALLTLATRAGQTSFDAIGVKVGEAGQSISDSYNSFALEAPKVVYTALTALGNEVTTITVSLALRAQVVTLTMSAVLEDSARNGQAALESLNASSNAIKDQTTSAVVASAAAVGATTARVVHEVTSATANGVSTGVRVIGTAATKLAQSASTTSQSAASSIGSTATAIATATSTVANNVGQGVSLVTTTIANETSRAATTVENAVTNAADSVVRGAKDGVSAVAFTVGEKTQEVSENAGFAIVKFGYMFVNEPTTISNVVVKTVSPTEVMVSWETNHPANGKVNYGFDRTYPFDVQSEKRVTHHEFTLSNLTPDTLYYFEVMSQNKNYVYDANREFKTPKEGEE